MMHKQLVMTMIGPDRVGIVDRVTHIVLKYDANVEDSSMAWLGGEFAVLMLIVVSGQNADSLKDALSELEGDGFQIIIRETFPETAAKYQGWLPYKITVVGADHAGIIQAISHQLAEKKINVETLYTDTVAAPMSGTPLFFMNAVVLAPPALAYHDWKDKLDEIAEANNVTVEIEPYRG